MSLPNREQVLPAVLYRAGRTEPDRRGERTGIRYRFGDMATGSEGDAPHMQTAEAIATLIDLIAHGTANPLSRMSRNRLGRRFFPVLLAVCGIFASSSAAPAQASPESTYLFPSLVNVGSSSPAQMVTVKIQTSGTIGQVQVLTGGAPNLDFAANGGTCATGSAFTAGQTCTASVVLTAKAPGIRSGAVVLMDSNGNSLGSELLSGVGVGPLSVMTAGEITTVAGDGHLSTGVATGNAALDAVIHEPLGIATDGAGNFYYTDSGNNFVGKVDPAGNLTYVAGTGAPGFSPNGTIAANALISAPSAILLDGAGNIYFSDTGNNVVREIVQATGLIETVAGTGTIGYTGDGAAATLATLSHAEGLAIDSAGNLYIADTGNSVIREVGATTGIITTIAGTATAGYTGDGGLATSATLDQPWGIFAWSDGSLYIADFMNNAIRRIDATGKITTVAGNGTAGYTGDTGPATAATMDHPASVALDAAGDFFVSDSENNVVRKVNGTTRIITTLAATGVAGSSGDGFDADNAMVTLNKPYGLALDAAGDLYVADRLGLVVREILATVARIQYKDIKVTNTSAPTIQEIDNDGNAALHLSSITAVSNAAIDPATTTCSTAAAMSPGTACVIGAEFKPETVGSPIDGSISIASDSSNTPLTILLYGNSLSIEPTTTTLTSNVNPSAVGGAVTFAATVASGSSTLTGSVQFLDGTTVLGGTAVLLNTTARTATYTTTSLALGSHSITAVYSGDNANQTSTSSALIQVVKQTSSLSLTSNDNPAHVYDPITFTVTASESPSGGTTPTGAVVFSADGSQLPNGTIALANGVASYTTSLLASGTHNITASYAGDTNDLAGSSNTLIQVVNLATTATALTSSNATVPLTTTVTFTASVNGGSTSTPTGNVVFKDGTATIGTTAVNNAGVATFATSSLTAGSHQITAAYQGDTDFAASTSAALTETIQKIATSTAVTSNLNPADAGAAVAFTVTVTAASTTTPNVAITGSVNLMEGSTVVGTGTLTASGTGPAVATATITVSSLAPGAAAITAVYAGDNNYVTSTSNGLLETITLATSSIALVANPTTAIATKPVTLTATLTSNGGTPTGSVSFLDGTVTIGTGNLNKGVASFTTSTLAVGSHSMTAVYNGDAKDSVTTSSAVIVTVSAATTSVALTPSLSPTDFGQPFTLTAKVTGNGGTPTGSVTFFDGTAPLQSVAVNASGVATFTTSTLTDGSHTFTASYAGDANDLASTSPALTVVVLQTATLTLTSTSPNPAIARSDVHFVATITAQQGIQPTGSVTFKDGATTLGTGIISGTTATFDTTTLSVGTHSIVASYAGDGATQPINSPPYSQVINAAGATVTLTSSANPATFGTLLTFTAAATSTAGNLTGTVNFEDGGVTIGSGALSSTGVATFSTTTLTPGTHSIVAAYQGDTNDQPASSSTLQQVVERTSSIALTSSSNPLLTLAPVTITATVANGGTTNPTGTVTFMQDGVVVATGPLGTAGTATLQVSSLTVGAHSFTASYSGDVINLASASPTLTETVDLRATTDSLTTSASSLTGGQQLTLISIVRWTGSTTPTGTVTFLNGTMTLATAPVDPTGVATVTVLLSGTSASVSSSYSGDASYAPSTSAPTLVTIGPSADFTLGASPTSFQVVTKEHEDLTITIASVKGFTDTLSLGCLGLPQAATCTFSKNQMLLSAGGEVMVTLTVDTGNPLLAGAQAKLDAPVSFNGSNAALACFLPGGLLLGLLGLRVRRLRTFGGLMLILCLAGISTALTGCGGVSMGGTPPGTYTFNISAHGATGVSQSIPVTMKVTQ